MAKKNKKIMLISIFIIIFLIILGGLFFVMYSSSIQKSLGFLKSSTEDWVTMQIFSYDQNGNPSNSPQTIVNGRANMSYVRLVGIVSNAGVTPLSNLRIQDIHPDEFDQSLGDKELLRSSLAVGETNILLFDTASICSTDLDCGASEKCINSKCFIDVKDFLGNMTFGFTVLGDYSDAYGNLVPTNATINLPINFREETIQVVIFRTNAIDGKYVSNTWVAMDTNTDGVLECYVYSSSTVGVNRKYATTFVDVYGKEWAGTKLYTGSTGGGVAGSYSYRTFKSGTGCELSTSPVGSYAGKEMYK